MYQNPYNKLLTKLRIFEILRLFYLRNRLAVFGKTFRRVFCRRKRRNTKLSKINLIYDELIYNHWVDAIAGGDLFPRGYHQPNSQHVCVDLSYH